MLPGGEIIKDSVAWYVVSGMSRKVSLLLTSVQQYLGDSHALPSAGGLMDQSPDFLDALHAFEEGRRLYQEEAKLTKKLFEV